MANKTTKSALSYFGSDAEVAEDLASRLDHCRHVTIPFVGGASIIPHLKAKAIVANDLHDFVINFYRMLSSGHRQTLIEMCEKTLSHPSELDRAQSLLRDGLGSDKLVQAWAFWAICWLDRKGKGGTKHQSSQVSVRWTATGGTNATRLKVAAAGLDQWATSFERCEWLCQDFRKVMEKIADREDNGVYIDAPWVGSGRNYLHRFQKFDHEDLAEHAHRFVNTTVLIRYDDCDLVRRLYHDFDIQTANSRNQANNQTNEVWITNRRESDG